MTHALDHDGPATFQGFARETRRAGVRDHVLVVPSVICSGVVAETIAEGNPRAVCAPHDHGCGQIGADRNQTRRTLLGVCENPNVAGVLLVGLGCETLDSEALAADLDVPVRQTAIQTAGGTGAAVEAGNGAIDELTAAAHTGSRDEVALRDLTLGVTVSDLSGSTLDEVHPRVRALVRSVLDAGGRVVVAGVESLVPFVDEVDGLAADEETRRSLRDVLRQHRAEHPPTEMRRTASGLSRDRVASLWDGDPVREVLAYGERTGLDSGVALVDSSDGFEETATALVAAGAQVVVHGTADGIPTGHPVVPVLKVTGNPDTVAALGTDIDVDARSDLDDALSERLVATLDGEPTAAEEHGLVSFAINRSGPSL